MKYFTPELLHRYGSSDPAVYRTAAEEWEGRCERYKAYIETAKAHMPAGLLDLDRYLLHDAVVRAMGRKDDAFVITVQLDAAPHTLLTFTYDLVAEPVIKRGVLPPEECTPDSHIEWQYDEVEEIEDRGAIWEHSILLSNGWELCIRFRDVEVTELQPVFAAEAG
jgi:hypothetical protein